jgi:DNA-binding Xre family transcriptional regulator
MKNMEKFNLKLFREQKLNISDKEMARQMELPLDIVVDYENNPEKISIEIITKLCSVFSFTPNDLLNFTPQKPKALNVPAVYEDTKQYINELYSYLNNENLQEKLKGILSTKELSQIENQLEYAKIVSSKPVVAFLGPSDAGKSSMINSLTGLDVLLSKWTPTTSATVYLKHIDDRPEWMGNDEVWIFKEESPTSGWDYRKYNDKDYCEQLKIIGGKKEILTDYANRNKKRKHLDVDSAIVYLESPVLNGCDIVDLPGFGTDTEKDTVQASRVRDKADVVVFLCQSNGFFNKSLDIEFAKDVIKHLSRIDNSNNAKFLSNLFIVASQAHIVGQQELQNICYRGYQAISEQFSDDWIQTVFSMNRKQFNSCLKPRFFSYSTDSSIYRSSFVFMAN